MQTEIKYPLKNHLVMAVWQNIVDNNLTPYATIIVDSRCQVPQQFVKRNEEAGVDIITFNLSMSAANNLAMSPTQEMIKSNASFGGKHMEIMFPFACIVGVFAKEERSLMVPFNYDPIEQEQAPVPPRGKPSLSVVK